MRDYRKEYREYQGKPEQIKRRASRNAARRKMMKLGRVKKGDGKDVHHKSNNPTNNSSGNLAVTSVAKNRGYPRDANNKPKAGLSRLGERVEALIELASLGTAKRVIRSLRKESKAPLIRSENPLETAGYLPKAVPMSMRKQWGEQIGLKKIPAPNSVYIPREGAQMRAFRSNNKGGLLSVKPRNIGMHEYGHAADPHITKVTKAMRGAQQKMMIGGYKDSEIPKVTEKFMRISLRLEKRANKGVLRKIEQHGSPAEAQEWKKAANLQMKEGYRTPLFKEIRKDKSISQGKAALRSFPWLRRKNTNLASRIENLIEFGSRRDFLRKGLGAILGSHPAAKAVGKIGVAPVAPVAPVAKVIKGTAHNWGFEPAFARDVMKYGGAKGMGPIGRRKGIIESLKNHDSDFLSPRTMATLNKQSADDVARAVHGGIVGPFRHVGGVEKVRGGILSVPGARGVKPVTHEKQREILHRARRKKKSRETRMKAMRGQLPSPGPFGNPNRPYTGLASRIDNLIELAAIKVRPGWDYMGNIGKPSKGLQGLWEKGSFRVSDSKTPQQIHRQGSRVLARAGHLAAKRAGADRTAGTLRSAVGNPLKLDDFMRRLTYEQRKLGKRYAIGHAARDSTAGLTK